MSRNNDGLPMLPPWLSESEVTQVGYEAPVQNLPHDELIDETPQRKRGRFKGRAPETERPEAARPEKRRKGWRRDKSDENSGEERGPAERDDAGQPGTRARQQEPPPHHAEQQPVPAPADHPRDSRQDPEVPQQSLPTRNPAQPSPAFQPLGRRSPEPTPSPQAQAGRPELPPPPLPGAPETTGPAEARPAADRAPHHAPLSTTSDGVATEANRPALGLSDDLAVHGERSHGGGSATPLGGERPSVPPTSPTDGPAPAPRDAAGPAAPDQGGPPPWLAPPTPEHAEPATIGAEAPRRLPPLPDPPAPQGPSNGLGAADGQPEAPNGYSHGPNGPADIPNGQAGVSRGQLDAPNGPPSGPNGQPGIPGERGVPSRGEGAPPWLGHPETSGLGLDSEPGMGGPGPAAQSHSAPSTSGVPAAGFIAPPETMPPGAPAGTPTPTGTPTPRPSGRHRLSAETGYTDAQAPHGPQPGPEQQPIPAQVDPSHALTAAQTSGLPSVEQVAAQFAPARPHPGQQTPADQWRGAPGNPGMGPLASPPPGFVGAPNQVSEQAGQWQNPAQPQPGRPEEYGLAAPPAPVAPGYPQPPAQTAGPQWGSAVSGYGQVPQAQFPSPSLEDVPLRRARKAPGSGWRKAVHHVSGGAINPGMSAEERRLQELVARIRQPVRGDYRIAVLSLKGGVGKTTTTMGIGSIFASVRGDRVIAVDANPDFGTLSQRVPLQTKSTVRDLLLDPSIQRYSDVRRHTSQASSRLEVLASERDPAASEAFSEEEYRAVARILQRFYNIILTDCGTGLMHSAMAGVLDLAHSLVLISSPAIDGARSAAATLDWLSLHGHDHLVRNAVVVINSPRAGSPNVGIQQLREYFLSRCRAVHIIPFDAHMSEGAEIDLHRLHKQTKRAYVELAATVADDFATDHRRYRP